MNYYDAARIRKKGFANLMTDKLASGQGVVSSFRGALSDRSKAKSLAMKEKFDPMNIAKFLTGGSNLAPAIVGRLTGRSKEDIGYFTGKRQYQYTPRQSNYWQKFSNPNMGGSRRATQVLEKIVSFMEKSREDDIKEQDTLDSYNELNEYMKQDNHKEVMDVFKEAIKNKRKAMKEMAKEAKKRQAQEKAEKKKEQAPKTKTEAPKQEAPKTKTEAPKQEAPKTKPETPKTEAAPTARPVESTPSAPPTATPTTPTVTPKTSIVKPAIESAKTAAKVVVGVAGVSAMSSAIGGAESGGNYDVSYGDSLDKKTGKMVNRAKDPKTNKPLNLKTPEEFSGKKLTEMTLDEVKAFGEYRSQNGAGAGAVGKYQFMPSTLFGRINKKGVFVPGLVQQLKKPMSSLFNQTLQDELQNALRSQDIATLKRLGVPITPGYEYMAHYIGAGGAAAVFKSVSNGEDKTVAQVMIDSGYSVGNNQELYKLRAIEFEKILQGRLERKGNLTPHSEANVVGEKADITSKENADMRKNMSQAQGSTGASPIVNQNNITNRQRNITISSPPLEELNPRMRH
jgi:chemotaxis protein histidine kinase CheA